MRIASCRTRGLLSVVALLICGKVALDFVGVIRYFQGEQLSRSKLTKDLSYFRLAEPTHSEESSPSLCAYAFVIGGCDSGSIQCDGFIYNILVAAQILKEEGSKHDVVAMFQMSINSTTPELRPAHAHALKKMDIRIRYIDPSPLESFFDTVINKFRILELTEYKRVLLMDGDVMPLSNLDYLFDLSLDGTLKENVVVAGALEPANGGFFMLETGNYEELQVIMQKRAETSLGFSELRGWGHLIEPPDQWVARRPGIKGTNWTFHFAFSDQGLLYYWVKYYKRSVSIIFAEKVENWAADETGVVQLGAILPRPFANYSRPRIHVSAACRKFMCDFMHFVGSKKPWLKRPPKDLSYATRNTDAFHMWWFTLMTIDRKLSLQIDFANWRVWQTPPLGGYATIADMEKHARAIIRSRDTKQLQ